VKSRWTPAGATPRRPVCARFLLGGTSDKALAAYDSYALVIRFPVMQRVVPSRSDAPALIVMAVMFLSFGLFAIVRPEALRAAMDNFANAWKQDSWHPYKMSNSAIRLIVGGIGILGAVLFVYIACIALSR
jgi:hypothetical protein